ncbi:MAG: 50S ribosomal protein L23 [Defluviitaleaceae bacterium]|nr:50S ribosomal protein L23 [Defluviitaleaceae bacterium]
MADLKYYDIILKPVITEKSMNEMADKKYAFYVHPSATKNQIKEAVQKMFEGTVVDRVNTMNLMGKKKRTRSHKYGRRPARKKAIIKLTPDSKEIEIFQGM